MRFVALVLLVLLLPGCAHKPPVTAGNPAAVAGSATTSVMQGENIYDVAKRLNVPASDLIGVNHLTAPYNIRTGQVLTIPVPQIYTVAKGDTLGVIAKRFGIASSGIAQANHLAPPYKIFVGQQLKLSGNSAASSQPVESRPETPVAAVAPAASAVESAPLAPFKPQGNGASASPTALAPPNATPTPPAAAGVSVAQPTPASAPAGTFQWPVQGDIVSGFGEKPGGLHSDGIYIAAATGTPVKSTAAGTVAYASNELRAFGNLILIRHADGWISAYAHLDSMQVKKGDAVKAGQVIGAVGQTGSVDSPQLYFELRRGKQAVDPTTELGTGKP